MRRSVLTTAAFAGVFAVALLGLKLKAEPETVDARNCIPGDAWLYFEGGPSPNADWKGLLLGGLPDNERKEAEQGIDEIWKELTELASREAGTDIGKLLQEVDRAHFALLDFRMEKFQREAGNGQSWESDRPEVDAVIIIKSKTRGYFTGLLEGDLKRFVQPGAECRNRKTWILDTHTGGDQDMKTVAHVHVASVGDCLFFTNVRETLEKMIGAADGVAYPGGAITANPEFLRAQKAAGKDAMAMGFVNLKKVFEGVEASLDRDDLAEYQQVDAVAGHSSLKGAVMWSGLDGRYSYGGMAVYLDPANELWSILKQDAAPKHILSVVPAQCVGTAVFTINDPAKTWERLRAFINAKVRLFADPKDPDDAEAFENGLAEAEKSLGISFGEIAAALGDEIGWAGYVREGGTFDETSQIVFAEVKDIAKAKAVIDALKDGEAIRGVSGGGEWESVEVAGVTCWNVVGGEVPFGYTILNDKIFVLTFDPEIQKAVVECWKKGEVLENDKYYKAAMRKLPAENSKLFYYNYLRLLRTVGAATREFDAELIEDIKGEMGVAAVSVEKADEVAWLSGAELDGELTASAIKAALPALREAREGARRTQQLNSLRMISVAAVAYQSSASKTGDYPFTLQQMVDANVLGAAALKKNDGTDGKYLWFHPVKGDSTGMDFLLAVDNEALPSGERVVVYFSGAVETVSQAKLDEMLAAQYIQLGEDIPGAIEDVKDQIKGAEGDQKTALEEKAKFLEAYLKDVEEKAEKK